MSLPADFSFSQASLQDYVDCPRRFQLRYVERVAWPTPVGEPLLEVEEHLARGVDLHRLVHQHLVGMDPQLIRETIRDAKLEGWWEAYLSHPLDLPAQRYPEISVTAPLGGYRLMAKFDLVAAAPGERLVVVDWKTNEGRRPRREWLAERMQTRVYRYMLVKAGQRFNGGAEVAPERVEMIYWFANYPAQPERFRYGGGEHARDQARLEALIHEIASRAADAAWEMAPDQRACRYCRYASLCERDGEPGSAADVDEETAGASLEAGFDLDLEQVAEVEF